MSDQSIAFIGGGNMASSLIGGLTGDGWNPDRILVSDPSDAQREKLVARFQIHSSPDNIDIASKADIIVLAVKPQQMKQVLNEIAATVEQNQPLIISIAAGVKLQSIATWLDSDVAIVRTMPNTPALVQTGATVLFANKQASVQQRDSAESILRAAGITFWVDREELLDTVTALSGSGPAYFFLMMEALQAAGQQLGLDETTARLLTIQTALGSARMALESTDSPDTLRQRVTSPGGTTEAALKVLDDGNIRELLFQAVKAAQERSRELANQMGE